jgi:hypothetical protein
LGLFAALKLLVELKLEARNLGHLLLGEVSPKPKIAKILCKSEDRRHSASYQSYRLAYHRMIVLL